MIASKRRSRNTRRRIELIVYDFDGVMTDNKVLIREDGLESVVVNRSDGLAIAAIRKMGIPQMILTTEKNRVVRTRAAKLGIPVARADDKKRYLLDLCGREGIDAKNVAYIGNDINDLGAMKVVGCGAAPLDADKKVKAAAKFVLSKKGGDGVVMEFFDLISK